MADVLTAKQRSYNMSRIRSTGTGPEMIFQELLRKKNITDFETHPKDMTGRPDFYFRNKKMAVFIDGCFWHGCKTCFKMPATNTAFWRAKIKANILRDRKVNRMLAGKGVSVLRVREHDLKKNPEKILATVERKLSENCSPTVLDLFAGAGGFSEGFVRAGCEIVGHIEMDSNACSTIVTRMIYHALVKKGGFKDYRDYVLGKISRDALVEKYELQRERDSVICSRIGKDNFRELIRQIRKRLEGRDLDIIIGGPPCQAYSYIGRARDERNMKRDDRNFLYRYYVKFLKALKPKIFVFENVPGLESAGDGRHLREMRLLMKRAGYETAYKTLDAVDFGVPQTRKRIILVGWSKESRLRSYPDFPNTSREYRVKSFLADLPKIRSGQGKRVELSSKVGKLLTEIGIADRKFDVIMEHVARPNNRRDLQIYRRAILAKRHGRNIRYNDLPDKLKTHKNKHGFLDRFKVVDANADGAQTVVAHIAKDGHHYIHPDLQQLRSLTVREAARLQTFPDDYKFEGERSSQFRQIGNAVPPLLSTILAKELKKYI
ncbi:MAG TPA: DNA mismatch endonuclease Vsr [Bacteroidota bacterium]|nr:DNA mismatch endonuclease Vsr [Bacteroidota bacterium]